MYLIAPNRYYALITESRVTVSGQSQQANLLPVGDLLNLRGDRAVDVLQRDPVNAGKLYLIEGN